MVYPPHAASPQHFPPATTYKNIATYIQYTRPTPNFHVSTTHQSTQSFNTMTLTTLSSSFVCYHGPTPYLHLLYQWIWGHRPWHKQVGPNTCNHGWEESHDITLWYSTWIHWHHCVIPRPAIPGSVLLLCHWYPPQRSSPQSHYQGEESKSYSANRTYLPPLKLNSKSWTTIFITRRNSRNMSDGNIEDLGWNAAIPYVISEKGHDT